MGNKPCPLSLVLSVFLNDLTLYQNNTRGLVTICFPSRELIGYPHGCFTDSSPEPRGGIGQRLMRQYGRSIGIYLFDTPFVDNPIVPPKPTMIARTAYRKIRIRSQENGVEQHTIAAVL